MQMKKESLKTKLLFLIATCLISFILSGCMAKYNPPQNVLKLSQSINEEEAIKILNDNISFSSQEKYACSHLNLDAGILFINDKSTVKFNNDSFSFSNLNKRVVTGRSTKSNVTTITYKYEKADYGVLSFSDVHGLFFNYEVDAHYGCCPNYTLAITFFGKSRSHYINFCARNENDILAAIIKMMPHVEITTYSKNNSK